MKTWREVYGEDADGNRGVMTDMYELEYTKQEKEDIAEILYEAFVSLCGITGGATIVYNDIEIEVEIEEYHDELITLARADKDLSNSDLRYLLNEIEYYEN